MPTTTAKSKSKALAPVAERKALHAYLSEDAHEGWFDFSTEQGVSVSALLEVIGSTLAEGKDPAKEWTVTKLVKAARLLDAERRRRDRNRRS